MHVFDVLATMELLVLNIYTQVTPDNVILIIFGLRMGKIHQIFPPYSILCSQVHVHS